MKPIIEANKLSKKYMFNTSKGIETNLREEIYSFFSLKKKNKADFMALDEVSFNIYPGESVGIIGSNGAGKSTLLKILSGITTPTNGSVTIRGKVSSILEVGTGFHPELTGRENIYLNGALYGMTRKSIRKKFDEILDFSGVEKFIDTPFKHYSSGMQVRLAFSIIAHIESDILITDEVLAVGDAEFQKKSLKKMKEVFSEGRTIIFVSHQQAMVSMLTNRCLLLEKGRLKGDGETKEILKTRFKEDGYFNSEFKPESNDLPNQSVRMIQIQLTDLNGNLIDSEIPVSHSYIVCMRFEVMHNLGYSIAPVFQFKNPEGHLLFTSYSEELSESFSGPGKYLSQCIIPGNLLNHGRYNVTASIISQHPYNIEHFVHHNCLTYGIQPDPDQSYSTFYGNYTGIISPVLNWKSKKL